MASQLVLMGALLVGFGIKIPLFPFHIGYPTLTPRLQRLFRCCLPVSCSSWAPMACCVSVLVCSRSLAAGFAWLAGWAAISVLYGSLAAIAQTDMKRWWPTAPSVTWVMCCWRLQRQPLGLRERLPDGEPRPISGVLFLLVGVVYARTGTRDLNVLRGLLNSQRGLPLTGSLMIIGVMASAGIPGMAGFISEFLIFRGSLQPFPVATLLSMVGSGLTAVYFLLLVNRAFFGRLAIAPGAVINPRILDRVALREQVPAIALSLGVLALGLAPSLLSNLSEAATTGLSQLNGGLS